MLTIENHIKLTFRQLGKKNFYVESIIESLVSDPITLKREGSYKITITNRKYAITITLDREPAQHNTLGTYFTLHSSKGHKLYISKDEISNMDIFIDKLRLVGLG